MLDEQGEAIFSTIDDLAERVRKIDGTTMRSIGQVAKQMTIEDNDEAYVPPRETLRELMEDNKKTVVNMRKAHEIADKYNDSATTSILENFIDAAERRTWFLFEAQPPGRRQRGVRRISSPD
jgi:starvation-inducible DNA-binding protein